MKLFGSSSKGRHAATGHRSAGTPANQAGRTPKTPAPRTNGRSKKRMSKGKKAAVIILLALAMIVVLAASYASVWWWRIQPFYDILFPLRITDVQPSTIEPVVTESPTAQPDDSEAITETPVPDTPTPPIEEVRNMNKVTILILGIDGYKGMRSEGGGNTDVIMVASFDMDDYTLDISSIPRDMIVNVPWSVKKINSVWASMRQKHRGSANQDEASMRDTKEHFADLLGFYVDYWVTVDMAAFESLVNAMPGGGVRYNVPYNIRLQDPDIGLDISLPPGERVLTGRQALAVVRYRGAAGGDFGRIDLQQRFIKAVADQVLANKGSISISDYADIMLKNVNTDLALSEMLRLGRELLELSSENINFYTAPASLYTKTGYGAGSYVVVELDEWLEIVNTKLSPYYAPITSEDVSILTLDDRGRFYVTDDNWQGSQNWGR